MRSVLGRVGVTFSLAAAVVAWAGARPTFGATTAATASPNGCVATAPATDNGTTGDFSCAYTATGPGAYAASTVDAWSISVDGRVVASGGPAAPGSATGALATVAGSQVVVTIVPVSDPTGLTSNVGAGAVAAGDQPTP